MKRVAVAVLLVAFAASSIAVKREVLRDGDASSLNGVAMGKLMPDFTLADTGGRAVTLSTLTKQNKVTLVNFWGTWCGPCRIEMPTFETLYKTQHDSGFMIVAIDEGDSRDSLLAYLRRKPVSFVILIDSAGKLADRLGVQAYPTSILVEKSGAVKRVIEGLESYLPMEVTQALKGDDAANMEITIGHSGSKK